MIGEIDVRYGQLMTTHYLLNRFTMASPNLLRRRFLQLSALAGGSLLAPAGLLALDRTRGVLPPLRDKDLLVHGTDPPNAEGKLDTLLKSWITPNKHFYVRSHAPAPKIDASAFRLQVVGLVNKELSLSAAEVQERFEQHEQIATLTCAGNRRSEHSKIKEVGGVQWQAGAIGNAQWKGGALRDLLKAAGVKPEAKHVWFEGVDEIERKDKLIPFGGSIPLKTAMGPPHQGALVAYGMNGQPLPVDHGFPLRTVVPGFIGARSVKWLGKIIVSDRPSTNHYLATAYKLVQEGAAEEWAAADPLYHFALNSVICTPLGNAQVKRGKIDVAGFALPSGGGNTIEHVEVATNDSGGFTKAVLLADSRPNCWRFWKASIPVTKDTRELVVRAVDSSGKRQPAKPMWNLKGYMFNAYYHTPIQVK